LCKILEQVRVLIARGDIRVSLHGYEELAADGIQALDVIDGFNTAVVIEDYPDYPEGAVRLGSRARSRESASSCSLGILRVETHLRLSSPRTGLTPQNGTRHG
jgi:hypothetical protein